MKYVLETLFTLAEQPLYYPEITWGSYMCERSQQGFIGAVNTEINSGCIRTSLSFVFACHPHGYNILGVWKHAFLKIGFRVGKCKNASLKFPCLWTMQTIVETEMSLPHLSFKPHVRTLLTETMAEYGVVFVLKKLLSLFWLLQQNLLPPWATRGHRKQHTPELVYNSHDVRWWSMSSSLVLVYVCSITVPLKGLTYVLQYLHCSHVADTFLETKSALLITLKKRKRLFPTCGQGFFYSGITPMFTC